MEKEIRSLQVTDANLILGRIDPKHVINTAGEISLDKELAEKYLMEQIGQPWDSVRSKQQ
jgi:N-methylhydantoinase A/oxoprolinase/acetone carboxylase beta subunit